VMVMLILVKKTVQFISSCKDEAVRLNDGLKNFSSDNWPNKSVIYTHDVHQAVTTAMVNINDYQSIMEEL
jgi:hypothetical protein